MSAAEERTGTATSVAAALRGTAILKRQPITAGEAHLAKLGERTFLAPWSYPGVYRDQRGGGSGDGKELCDLLVVFGAHIIIFSDKEIAYQAEKDPSVSWQRWRKRAVEHGAKQVFGAERWLRDYRDRVFLDAACTRPFPIPIPSASEATVHRVVVARGARDASRAWYQGGSGTLMVSSAEGRTTEAFVLGQPDPARGFVHVFDEVAIDIALSTVDTISDFIDYLERRRRFLETYHVRAAGEEDLLGFYLRDVGPDGKNDFTVGDEAQPGSFVYIEEGMWGTFARHPQRRAQIEADRISYAWDVLIDRFAAHAMGGTLYRSTDPHEPFVGAEWTLRHLAKEPRTRRRFLARLYVDLVNQTGAKRSWKARVVPPTNEAEPTYVFMVFRRPPETAYDEYRENRLSVLHAYMRCAKIHVPTATDIIGVAIGHPDSDDNSEDLLHIDCSTWGPTEIAEALELQRVTGFLSDTTTVKGIEKTYPDVPLAPRPRLVVKGSQRNARCPCGSGRKAKHCCARPA